MISVMDQLLLGLLGLSFILIVDGNNCKTLDGKWYNQLGSELFLKHGNDGMLLGEYRTARERFNGSAGSSHSIVVGKYELNRIARLILLITLLHNGCSLYNE